jgi:hypothetical protein
MPEPWFKLREYCFRLRGGDNVSDDSLLSDDAAPPLRAVNPSGEDDAVHGNAQIAVIDATALRMGKIDPEAVVLPTLLSTSPRQCDPG